MQECLIINFFVIRWPRAIFVQTELSIQIFSKSEHINQKVEAPFQAYLCINMLQLMFTYLVWE